jgi:hypothetical protein
MSSREMTSVQAFCLIWFHLSVFVPENGDEPDDEDDPIGQVLDSPAFQTQLLQAIRITFRQHPAMKQVVVRMSR